MTKSSNMELSMRRLIVATSLMLAVLTSCAGSDIFSPIGTNMANPISVAVDSTLDRLYIINSNYRVSYEDGSLHVVDISDLTSPSRVDLLAMPSFSGDIYLDTINLVLYTTNRNSSSETDTTDTLLEINVDESSASFLARTDHSAGDDPFGIICCDASNKILVATAAGLIDYYDLDESLAHASLNLTSNLSTGVSLSGVGSTRIVIIGTQAVVTLDSGGLWVINLDELGDASAAPIDYYISDVAFPRGIATDGTYIYVASADFSSGTEAPLLIVLDISTLTPVTDNTTTAVVDKDDDSLLVASVNIEDGDPREVLVAEGVAYVTHFDTDSISMVETTGFTKTGEIAVGDEPYGMAVYSPAGTATHLFVTNSGDASGGNTVSIIDLSTNGVIATYP